MTAEIIQSQIGSKQMTTDEIKAALNDTFQALKALQDAETSGTTDIAPEEASIVPLLDPKKSIQKNKVICLECGQEFKMLSQKHLTVLIQNHTVKNTGFLPGNRSVQNLFLTNVPHPVKSVAFQRISRRL